MMENEPYLEIEQVVIGLDEPTNDEFRVERVKDFQLTITEEENIFSGTSKLINMDDIENFNKLYVDMDLSKKQKPKQRMIL